MFSLLKFVVALSTFTLTLAHAKSADETITQVDLVFPRDGKIYKPNEHFPIVFALHNAAAAWPYLFRLHWALAGVNTADGKLTILTNGTYGSTKNDFPKPISFAAPESPHLVIDKLALDGKANYASYVLGISAGLAVDCPSFRDEDAHAQAKADRSGKFWKLDTKSYKFTEEITFYVSSASDDKAQTASLASESDKCAHRLGAIGIKGADKKNATCPVTENPPPSPKKCAVKVDDKMAQQVEKAQGGENIFHGTTGASVVGNTNSTTPASSNSTSANATSTSSSSSSSTSTSSSAPASTSTTAPNKVSNSTAPANGTAGKNAGMSLSAEWSLSSSLLIGAALLFCTL